MNALFEFYAALTDKQMNYIESHACNDYSLAEIAEEFGVSRQALWQYQTNWKFWRLWDEAHMYSDHCSQSDLIRFWSVIQKILFYKSNLRF